MSLVGAGSRQHQTTAEVMVWGARGTESPAHFEDGRPGGGHERCKADEIVDEAQVLFVPGEHASLC